MDNKNTGLYGELYAAVLLLCVTAVDICKDGDGLLLGLAIVITTMWLTWINNIQ